MGFQTKIRDEIRKEMVTKTHGQTTSQDLTILEKEIIAILGTSPLHWEKETMGMLE